MKRLDCRNHLDWANSGPILSSGNTQPHCSVHKAAAKPPSPAGTQSLSPVWVARRSVDRGVLNLKHHHRRGECIRFERGNFSCCKRLRKCTYLLSRSRRHGVGPLSRGSSLRWIDSLFSIAQFDKQALMFHETRLSTLCIYYDRGSVHLWLSLLPDSVSDNS